jgi:hypothetical protein
VLHAVRAPACDDPGGERGHERQRDHQRKLERPGVQQGVGVQEQLNHRAVVSGFEEARIQRRVTSPERADEAAVHERRQQLDHAGEIEGNHETLDERAAAADGTPREPDRDAESDCLRKREGGARAELHKEIARVGRRFQNETGRVAEGEKQERPFEQPLFAQTPGGEPLGARQQRDEIPKVLREKSNALLDELVHAGRCVRLL